VVPGRGEGAAVELVEVEVGLPGLEFGTGVQVRHRRQLVAVEAGFPRMPLVFLGGGEEIALGVKVPAFGI